MWVTVYGKCQANNCTSKHESKIASNYLEKCFNLIGSAKERINKEFTRERPN